MNKNVMNIIRNYKTNVVIFDIDGTLKDLCREHSNALKTTLEEFEVGKYRKKIVLAVNAIAMFIVKIGVISTNPSKQNFLVNIFAVLSGVRLIDFYDMYFENYIHELCLFEGASELLKSLNKDKMVYFATINKQNYNLEGCGIPQERIMYTEGAFKVATYNELLKSVNVNKDEVLIVGDNLFDDWFSAKHLGVKCLLVNRYNNKIKKIICRLVNGKHLR